VNVPSDALTPPGGTRVRYPLSAALKSLTLPLGAPTDLIRYEYSVPTAAVLSVKDVAPALVPN
jgi:hypothetical protein